MKIENAKEGLRVRTTKPLDIQRNISRYISLDEIHLKVRREGEEGILASSVPGQNLKIWWVIHPDRTVGVYMLEEVELMI